MSEKTTERCRARSVVSRPGTNYRCELNQWHDGRHEYRDVTWEQSLGEVTAKMIHDLTAERDEAALRAALAESELASLGRSESREIERGDFFRDKLEVAVRERDEAVRERDSYRKTLEMIAFEFSGASSIARTREWLVDYIEASLTATATTSEPQKEKETR